MNNVERAKKRKDRFFGRNRQSKPIKMKRSRQTDQLKLKTSMLRTVLRLNQGVCEKINF